MRRNLTYPKDGERKLKEENKQLRMQVSRLRKENELLRQQIGNAAKADRPKKVRTRDLPEVVDEKPEPPNKEEWRQSFIKEFKPKTKK